MKRVKHDFKKGMAFVLSFAMAAGLVPAMSGGADMVQAATSPETEPSVSAYATKTQLMTAFTPDSNGNATNIGKLVFGKNSSGNAQEWYILGEDEGISGDNTVIFVTSPIATEQRFTSSYTLDNTYNYEADTGYSSIAGSINVNPNHYGASDLRAALQSMSVNTDYFTTVEQDMMNPTTVTTEDTRNDIIYMTTDTLYALQGDFDNQRKLWAGTSDSSTVLAKDSYWKSGGWFWLRSPSNDEDNEQAADFAMLATPGEFVSATIVRIKGAVWPASNLNLSSVLFASAATAASSDTAESGTIASDTAMTLRLDGTDKNIGTVTYNPATGDIKAAKGAIEGDVALVVQGNDNTSDWYYSKQITGTETVNVSAIVSETNTPEMIDLSDCKIWLETTDSTENMTFAVNATELESITSVEITGIHTPTANTTLDTEASCTTTGVSSTTPQITWTPGDSIADYNTSYTASIILTADTGYEFIDSTTAAVSGNTATSVTKNADGTLAVTYDFSATAKREIVSVTAPTVPTDNTFTTYYGYDGITDTPISGNGSELGTSATVAFEGTAEPATAVMDVTWTIANTGDAPYDTTPGAENSFRWKIPASALTNYDASACQGYDANTGDITGTVTVKNKAATPVTITGTDSGINYSGAAIDISQYFDIDTNAGTATYSLVTGADGGTGEGSLNGTILTVTKIGTFKIKVETLANGIYGAGEKTVTLTVSRTIAYTADDYNGIYDGQSHSISVNVPDAEGAAITYSTDGVTYNNENPSFRDEGEHTVYYRITKDNYTTVEDSTTVIIHKKSVTITADNQDIVLGNDIDQGKYTRDGLVTGDSITAITLTPSTSSLTENGIISISGVKIENAVGADVTGNYDIITINGILKIVQNITLSPDGIENVTISADDIEKNSVELNTGISLIWKNNKLTINWKNVSGADGYDIFAAKCGAKMNAKCLVKTVKGGKSSASLTKIAGRKISGKEKYKVRIKAYKFINGKKHYIGNSDDYYIAGKNNKQYTNAKKITVSKKSVSLKAGKTSQIKAKIVEQSKTKKLLSKVYGSALRYYSTKKSIATVTAKGKIKAKQKGSCYIYIKAFNGVTSKVKVTVK